MFYCQNIDFFASLTGMADDVFVKEFVMRLAPAKKRITLRILDGMATCRSLKGEEHVR